MLVLVLVLVTALDIEIRNLVLWGMVRLRRVQQESRLMKVQRWASVLGRVHEEATTALSEGRCVILLSIALSLFLLLLAMASDLLHYWRLYFCSSLTIPITSYLVPHVCLFVN